VLHVGQTYDEDSIRVESRRASGQSVPRVGHEYAIEDMSIAEPNEAGLTGLRVGRTRLRITVISSKAHAPPNYLPVIVLPSRVRRGMGTLALVGLTGLLPIACNGDATSPSRSILTGTWRGTYNTTYTYTLTLTEDGNGNISGRVRVQCSAGCDVTGTVSGVRAGTDVSLTFSGQNLGCTPETFV